MTRRRLRVLSQAHEWVLAQGLCDEHGVFDRSLMQSDRRHVPTVALDDPFSGAEAATFYVNESGEDGTAVQWSVLGNCEGIEFPDGSAVWWANAPGREEFWSFTDPHGTDITGDWQLEPT